MYDKELVVEILSQISNAASIALERFEIVENVSFFTDTPEGMEKLDTLKLIGKQLKG